jgi:uncharacterized delta-60 repeat protein
MRTQAVLAALVAAAMTSLAPPAMAGAGQLDPSFGTNGIVVIPLNGPAGVVAKVLQQPNGELLVAAQGSAIGANNNQIVLLTAAGAVDTTFGVQGIATLSIADNLVEFPTDMQLQPDGRIVVVADVAAHAAKGIPSHGVVARFNANGTLDTSFGSGGVVALTPLDGSVADKPNVLLFQPNGQILVADVSGTAEVVLRLNADGTPDTSFGKRGTATVSRTGGAPRALALQSDGKIVAIATTAHRLLPNGTHDKTFAPGVVIASSALQAQTGTEPPLAVQADDSYLVSGTTGSIDQFFSLQRFKLTNKVAKSLQSVEIGFDGTQTTNPSQDYANIVQPNGSIVVAGRYLAGSDECFGLGRLLRNGALDTSFGSNGTVTTVFPGNNALATALVLQSDGNIVVAGITGSSGSSGSVAVARYLGR